MPLRQIDTEAETIETQEEREEEREWTMDDQDDFLLSPFSIRWERLEVGYDTLFGPFWEFSRKLPHFLGTGLFLFTTAPCSKWEKQVKGPGERG